MNESHEPIDPIKLQQQIDAIPTGQLVVSKVEVDATGRKVLVPMTLNTEDFSWNESVNVRAILHLRDEIQKITKIPDEYDFRTYE